VELAQLWSNAMRDHDIRTAQILLAPEDTETRRRHINARTTIQTLLGLGFVPVVNENDTVTTYEIRFGDNDRLAARLAGMISADLLILLSDVDGLYTKNPHQTQDAEHIPEIKQIDDEILALGGAANAEFASGGMATKLAAARIATQAGADMIICEGSAARPVSALLTGAKYSLFHRRTSPKKARKNWIAGALDPKGQIIVDVGAQTALLKGKSLLAVGVRAVSGQFERGDLVQITDEGGQELGHGLAGYSAAEAEKIKGQKSQVIETILGYEGRAELIHADDLVLRGDLADNQLTE
jgi:glutamate 5-kinase